MKLRPFGLKVTLCATSLDCVFSYRVFTRFIIILTLNMHILTVKKVESLAINHVCSVSMYTIFSLDIN